MAGKEGNGLQLENVGPTRSTNSETLSYKTRGTKRLVSENICSVEGNSGGYFR